MRRRDGVRLPLVLVAVPVRGVDFDARQLRPLPAGRDRMVIGIDGAQIGRHLGVPAVGRLLLVQELPDVD